MTRISSTPPTDSNPRLAPIMPYILIVGGAIGLLCSLILSYDKLRLLQNPGYTPPCNLNPVVSCGSVLQAAEGSVFGFPNSWIGIAGFTVVVTIGAGMLAGATFRRWFWLSLEAGIGLAVIFAYWMLWQSVTSIRALCPFCLTVDIVITILFWYLSLYIIREGHLPIPGRAVGIADFARRHHLALLLIWILGITALILHHFWYYYGQYL